jgi:mycothiol synthase
MAQDVVLRGNKDMAIAVAEDTILRTVTLADAEAVTDLLNQCSWAAIGADRYTVQNLLDDWRFPGFNMKTDVRAVFRADGQAIAYLALWNRVEPYVRNFLEFQIHPSYRYDFDMARELLDWAEQAAMRKLPKAPADARVMMGFNALSTEQDLIQHIEAAGFEFNRHFLMMKIEMDAMPPEPQWPAGITLRTYPEVDDMRALVIALRDGFKDHWGYITHPLEEEIESFKKRVESQDAQGRYDPDLWFLAMDGDEIIGVSLCQPAMIEDQDMAYVNELCVRRPWRRQGIALALMHHSFRACYDRGIKKVALHVDASSLTGATRLYEKAGMHMIRRYDDYQRVLRDGVDLSTQSLG